jgi:hypothetical protein
MAKKIGHVSCVILPESENSPRTVALIASRPGSLAKLCQYVRSSLNKGRLQALAIHHTDEASKKLSKNLKHGDAAAIQATMPSYKRGKLPPSAQQRDKYRPVRTITWPKQSYSSTSEMAAGIVVHERVVSSYNTVPKI